MLKSLVLIVGCAVSVSAYISGPARSRIANDFEVANFQLEEVRSKYGMRYARASELARREPKTVGNWDQVEIWGNWFESAKGFAYGLQFSPNKPGECYYAVEAALDSAETI
jgi:hypothetical protein